MTAPAEFGSRARATTREQSTPQNRPSFQPTASLSRPLPATSKSLLEPLIGHDLSQVRVHDDPDAARSASMLGARAYTVGQHIYFGSGQYAPLSAHGRSLLAHELVHSVQQLHDAPATAQGAQTGLLTGGSAEQEAREIGSLASQLDRNSRYLHKSPRFRAPAAWPQLHDDGTAVAHTHTEQWDNPVVASVVYAKRDEMMKSITTTLGQEEAVGLGAMDDASRQKAVEAIRAQIQDRLTALQAAQDTTNPDTQAAVTQLQKLLAEEPKTVGQMIRWASKFLGTNIRTAGMSSAKLLAAARAQMQASNVPDWAQSILVDYGGMRYKSSHGSWLPAGDLLATILEYDLAHPDADEHIFPDDWPDPPPSGWPAPPAALATESAKGAKPKRPPKPPSVPRLENLTAQALLQDLRSRNAIPDEVWPVIVQFTELRVQTNDPGWEVIPGGRGNLPKTITEPWLGILTKWRGEKNFTAWRPEMERTNRVLATQIVCNELSEAIQARRSVPLPGGITANADWLYQEAQSAPAPAAATHEAKPAEHQPETTTGEGSAAKAVSGSPAKAVKEASSFKQGTQISAADLKPGATLFFIAKEWADKPHPWDAVRPVPGVSYVDPKGSTTLKDSLLLDGWRYHVTDDFISRTEELAPGVQGPLRPAQYMNWQHQATVVSVYNSTVITIETVGHSAGITTRTVAGLSVPHVFVGFVGPNTSGPGRTGEDKWAERVSKIK